jgi:hypothetical protein
MRSNFTNTSSQFYKNTLFPNPRLLQYKVQLDAPQYLDPTVSTLKFPEVTRLRFE